jgi:hypothetical protein
MERGAGVCATPAVPLNSKKIGAKRLIKEMTPRGNRDAGRELDWGLNKCTSGTTIAAVCYPRIRAVAISKMSE